MNSFRNKGVVFAQLRINTSNIKITSSNKTFCLFDSSDKISTYLDLTGDELKQLFYNGSTNFNMPTQQNGETVLGDFCYLDQWCHANSIGELIKEPYFFDFKNEIFKCWQKDLGINICDWDSHNNMRLYKELDKINKWIENKNYTIIKSLNYQELINTLKMPKLMKGNLIHLSILIKNDNPNISTIETVLNFRISEDET